MRPLYFDMGLRLFCKDDADGAGAGVAADGGADIGLDDMLKFAILAQTGFDGIHAAGFRLAGREKDHRVVDVVPAVQLVGDVLANADGQAAAVLFDDLQLAVDDGQTGLDAEDIGTESQHAGAATALGHKIQLVQDKTQLDPLGEVLKPHTNVFWRQAVCRPFCGAQHQIALPGADVLAVHDRNIFVFLRSKPGVLEAG